MKNVTQDGSNKRKFPDSICSSPPAIRPRVAEHDDKLNKEIDDKLKEFFGTDAIKEYSQERFEKLVKSEVIKKALVLNNGYLPLISETSETSKTSEARLIKALSDKIVICKENINGITHTRQGNSTQLRRDVIKILDQNADLINALTGTDKPFRVTIDMFNLVDNSGRDAIDNLTNLFELLSENKELLLNRSTVVQGCLRSINLRLKPNERIKKLEEAISGLKQHQKTHLR